eukprot:TRINITY_DN34406_c0_g1_i1.p1 TRINITY_DN34406_c0_g1~~TRINITY_DN34406_c0_g1_i1.p1  ORF type:complete len:157 (-),score=73.99 TRINITY_DN34406_c0_g1_i1:128-598(-)
MAAVSHLKNKKDAKLRESIEKVMHKCSTSGGPVSVKEYMELLESAGIVLEDKEVARLDRLTDKDGIIEREEFVNYAKKSPVMKQLLDGERARNVDKAELAFKAIDRDHSGYITAGELSKLGDKMNQKKTEALMGKLDTNGDGKITLTEFRELFKHK